MKKVRQEQLNTNNASDSTEVVQRTGQEDLSHDSSPYLEELGRYRLSKFMVVSPENHDGNCYLHELESINVLPTTISWWDENGWMNRLYVRPPGLFPQSLSIGRARYRFITDNYKGDELPKICEWLPFRTFLNLEPAEIPLCNLEYMFWCSRSITEMINNLRQTGSLQGSEDQEDITES